MAVRPPPAPSSTPFIDALGHEAADRRIEVLRGIAATGSISQAARETGVSYKAAWQAIDTLTNLAGVPLVRRAVGGAGGGGAALTAQGARLLELAQALDAARREVHARWLAAGIEDDPDHGGGIDPDGETNRGDDVAGTALSRLALRTSMRNQLPATVEGLEMTGRIARVVMRLDGRTVGPAASGIAADRIAARITRESAELLGLRPGLPVIALCKATAVRVGRRTPERVEARDRPVTETARGAGGLATTNRLAGTVAGVTRGDGDGGDELAVALAGGLQLIGFAAGGTGLRTRQQVRVSFDEAALVVALAG
jgi:molybdate transport system regulatory protein